MGKKGVVLFDDVTPFVNGMACVYVNKEGWRHIDVSGKERFILEDKKPVFRSSVHKGECVIVAEDGIKQYQENEQNKALVKKILSNTATLINMHEIVSYLMKVYWNLIRCGGLLNIQQVMIQ